MKNIRFLWYNLYDLATTVKTASSEGADFPLTNIVNRWHTRCWRATGDAAEWIKMDLGAATGIKAFGIKNHNFTDASVIRIQGNAADNWADPTVNVIMDYNADNMVEFWDTAQSFRWWRLSMVDAANPDTYLKIGRLFIGTYFSTIINFSRTYLKQIVDPSTKMYSTGGQVSVNEKSQYKIFRYDFDTVDNIAPTFDKDALEEIFTYVGQAKGYFICQDADDKENTFYYVENMSDWEFQHIGLDRFFSLGIDISELR